MSRRFLITGAGSGLGAAFAAAALDRGHSVTGTVRQATAAQRFAAQAPGRAHGLVLDMNDAAAIPGAVAEAERLMGGIDVLVNNAGYGQEGILEESPLESLRRQFEINVFAVIAMVQAALPGMRARRSGHIINITSMAGHAGFAGLSGYCGSKFALEGISEALGKELRPLGIHVTAVAPGQFRTDWAGRSMERSPRHIADYDAVMDPARAARQAKSGQQKGNPAKAAAALMALVEAQTPPAHLLLGSDALHTVRQKLKQLESDMSAWQVISADTAYDD